MKITMKAITATMIIMRKSKLTPEVITVIEVEVCEVDAGVVKATCV